MVRLLVIDLSKWFALIYIVLSSHNAFGALFTTPACIDNSEGYYSILKSNQLSMNFYNPKRDLEQRLAHKDYRFLSITKREFAVPSIDLRRYDWLIYHTRHQEIEGVTPIYQSQDYSDLLISFNKYARAYNTELLNYFKKHCDMEAVEKKIVKQIKFEAAATTEREIKESRLPSFQKEVLLKYRKAQD